MATVQDVGSTAALQNATSASPSVANSQESQDRFLKLLVTQMKNQDPLNPMDNAQVTTQMAQISTVSGIEKLNATLEALSARFASTQGLATADVIGRGVLVPGSTLTLDAGQASFGAELTQPADSVVVSIQDAAGRTLHRVDLGAQSAGTIELTWDGTIDGGGHAANGPYQFAIAATANKAKVDTQPLTYGRVNGVVPGAQGTTLQVDRLGTVPLTNVKEIL